MKKKDKVELGFIIKEPVTKYQVPKEKAYEGSNWRKYLRAPEIFFTILEKGGNKLVKVGDIVNVETYLNTLGADKFFFVSIVKRGKKTSIIRSRINNKEFEVENEFLVDLIESPKELSSIAVSGEFKTKLFRIPFNLREITKTKAYKYILLGKEKGFNTHLPAQAYDGKLTIMACYLGDSHIINYNPYRVISHRFFRINIKNENVIDAKKLTLLLNSTFNSICMEILRNPSLGAGVLAHGTYTIKQFMFPKPDLVNLNLEQFDNFFKRNILSVFEECGFNPHLPIRDQEPNPLPDRKKLDNIIFNIFNLTKDERKEVYWAVCELVKERLEKAKTIMGKEE